MPIRPRRERQTRYQMTPRLEVALSSGPVEPPDPERLEYLRNVWREWGAWLEARDDDPGWRPWAFWQFEGVPERLRGPVSKLMRVLEDADEERRTRERERLAAERLDAARRRWLANQS